jgi:hypothetical protein
MLKRCTHRIRIAQKPVDGLAADGAHPVVALENLDHAEVFAWHLRQAHPSPLQHLDVPNSRPDRIPAL